MACRVQCHQKGVYKLNIRNDIRNVAIIAPLTTEKLH